MDYAKHVYHLYAVRVKNRRGLQAFLKERRVETAVHYPIALPFLNAYKYLGCKAGDFPNAEGFMHEILSLPMFPELTEEQIHFVVESIKEFGD